MLTASAEVDAPLQSTGGKCASLGCAGRKSLSAPVLIADKWEEAAVVASVVVYPLWTEERMTATWKSSGRRQAGNGFWSDA